MTPNDIINVFNTEYNNYINQRKWLINQHKIIVDTILTEIEEYQKPFIDFDKMTDTLYEIIFDGLLEVVDGDVEDWDDEIVDMIVYQYTEIDNYITKNNL